MSLEKQAIRLIEDSISLSLPAAQGAMPRYYSEKTSLLHEAIELLQQQTKKYQKQSRSFNMNRYNNYNYNFNSMTKNNKNNENNKNNKNNENNKKENSAWLGGKRRRVTRKQRK